MCFSNEFFDALPIHIFHRNSAGWDEILVDAVDLGDDVQFRFVRSRGVTAAMRMLQVEQRYAAVAQGETIELCPEAGRIASLLAGALRRSGGLFITFDYGRHSATGASLRVASFPRSFDAMGRPYMDIEFFPLRWRRLVPLISALMSIFRH